MRLVRLLAAAAIGVAVGLGTAAPASAQVCAAPGSGGTVNVAGIVNTYYPGAASASAGSSAVAVGAPDGRGAATPIAAGDLLLIVQVQDAAISTSNSTAYGGSGGGQGYTSLNSAGLFEYAVAAGPVSLGAVPLAAPLANNYTNAAANAGQGQRRFQVIRVPQYSSAIVTGTVTAPPWDGSTGGIVAFDVAGNLNWNGQAIDVNGRGFRGGGAQCSTSNGTGVGVLNSDYVTRVGTGTINLAGVGSVPNGTKGEGVAGTPILVFTPTTPFDNGAGTITNTGGTDGTTGGYPGGSFGRGAPGNGGGGGTDGNPTANDQNTGGAGGGNFGIGGKGGFGWTPLTPPGFDTGGMGGMSMPVSPSRLFFGGGGGSGSTNNCTGTPANGRATSGAAGGGMVLVRAGTTSGAGTINARGTAGNTTILNDASGGGGAGGSVLLFVDNGGAATGAAIDIRGGNGGSNTGSGSPHGPGGGGSGGYAAVSGSATVTLSAGANGTTATSPTSTIEYGSTSSVGGFNIVNLGPAQIPGAGVSSACFPVLTVSKSTTTPYVSAGAPATWTITVANQAGKGAADSVVVSDALPSNPNITFGATTSVALANGATRPTTTEPAPPATATPSWSSFRIPGGGSVAITFTANVAASVASGVYQNPANVTYLDPTRTAAQTVTPGGTYTAGGTVPGANYASGSTTFEDVTVVNPPPSFTKSFNPAAIAPGATTVMTIVVGNPNALALTNAGFTDNYPPGLVNTAAPAASSSCGGTVTAPAGGATFALSGATIPASSSCTVTVNVTTTADGSYVNTLPVASLTNTQGITNTIAATATLFSTVTVAKSFSPTAVGPGIDATLTLAIANPNTVAVSLASPGLTDNFPPNLRATGGAVTVTGAGCAGFAPAAIAANATSLVLTAGTIPAGGSCSVSFLVNSAVTGVYNNTTSGVTTTAGTTGPPSNTSSLGVGLVNIAKNFSPAQIQPGAPSTLTYTLTNPTGVPQTGGAFLDTLINMQASGNQAVGGTCTGTTPAALTDGQTALNFTGINVPAGSCTVTVVVTSNVVGTHPNAANGVTTSLLPQGPGSNTDFLTVVGKPAIAKAFSPAGVTLSGASTLTFTIANPNTIALTGIGFTDAYPAGIVNATPLAVGGTCTGVTTTAAAGGASFNVTGGTVAAATSCTITVGVTGTTAGAWNNTASGVASAQSGTAGAASNTATLTVSASPTIAKSFATSPIAQGGTSVITFTLANPNATALTSLRFTDALANMTVASATIGGTCAGTTSTPALLVGATALDLTVPSLAGGAGCTVTVTVTSAVSGTHANTASGVATTQTPVAGAPSNTALLTVLSPPVLQKNFVPGTIEAGGTSSIVFTLANPQAAALAAVSFSDPLVNMALAAGAGVTETCTGAVTPAGVAAGSTNFTLTLNSLAASESCTITVGPVTSSVTSPAAGHANTTSAVASTQTAVNPGAAATGYLRVVAPPVITKSFASPAIASGGTTVVTFTLTNPNAVALTDVRFTDNLPTNLLNSAAQTFIGGGRGTCTGTIPSAKAAGNLDPINFASTNIPANSSCTVLMDVTSSTPGAYTNTVTAITSDQTPTATTGGSDVLTVGALGINKRFCSNLPAATPGASTCTPVTDAQVNASVFMWITITNNTGVSNQNDLFFNDTLPAGMQTVAGDIFISRVAGQCDEAPGAIPNEPGGATTFNFDAARHLDDLDNLASCIVAVSVTGTTAGSMSNTVTGTSTGGGNAALNGRTDTASIRFWQAPTIAKGFSPSTIGAGGTSTVTITLTNPAANPGALANASFSDTLANMSVAGNQTVGGTCTGTTPASLTNGQAGLIGFSGIAVPQGGSCTVTFTVTSTNVGVNPNATSGVATTQAPAAGAGSAAANLTVVGSTLAKAFSPATITAGTVSRLTFTITNGAGNPAQPGLAFTETLPANVVVASPANAATTCTGGAVAAPAGGTTIALSGAAFALGDATCTLGVDVTSATAGTYNNLPGNISGLSPGLSAAGLAATLTVNASPALTKAFSPVSIAPGATSVLTFTITNGAGSPAQSGLAFTDTFPANVVVAATPDVQSNCPAGGGFAVPAFPVTAVAGTGSIAVSGASLGAGVASCQVRVNVTTSATGNYNNNASNLSALAGGLTAAGANATLAAVGTSLAKSFSPAVIGRGGVSTMTFVVTNGAGNPAQGGLQFTENLPANLFVAAVPNLVNTCGGTVTAAAGAGTIPFTGGSLAAGVASCSFSVDVTSAFVATYNNPPSRILNASATMDTSGVNATLEVLENVTVAKAFAPATIPAGTPSVLTITLTNANALPIAGAAFVDTYAGAIVNTATPAGATTCAGGTVTAAAGGNSVALSGATVPAGGSCTVTVNVTGNTPGAQANTIAAGAVTSTNAGSNPVAANATFTVVARPAVSKSYAPAEIGAGGVSTLTITLANANAATAITGVALTDTQPANVSPVAATAATTCGGTASQTATGVSLAGGTIPAAGSCTVSVQVTSATIGAHANTIAAGDVTSANAGTNAVAANATLTVLAAPTVAKAFSPASIFPTGTSVLTITLANPNATAITGVAFTDAYPPGIDNTATPAGATTCPGGAVTAAALGASVALSGATIPASGSCTVTVNVTSNAVGVYNNTTGPVTTANAGTAGAANATLTVLGGIASTKLFSPITIASGGTSTLTITLTNPNTTTTVTGIAFTDTYPAAITNSATPGPATTCPGGAVAAAANGPTLGLTGATLAPGASCTVTVQVTSSTAGTHVNAVGSITASNAPASGGDSTVLFVYAPPVATKSFLPASIGPGATSTLRLGLANPAGNPAAAMTGISVTDPLGTFNLALASPASVTFTPAGCGTVQSRAIVGSGAFGAPAPGHLEVRLDVASLAAGASCQADIGVTSVTAGAAANTTAAPGATGPAVLTGTAASATLTVIQAALTKAFVPATIDAGGISTLTFTLTNGAGNPAQSGVDFKDTLPGSVTVAPGPVVGGTCPGVAGVVSTVPGAVTVTGASMTAGQASCTITVDVTSGTPGAYANTDAGNITDTQRVTTTGVNATLTVQARPTLTKAFAPATVGVSQDAVLTFTIANPAGAPPRTGLTFTDTLPPGLVIGSPAGVVNNCGGAATITATPGAGVFAVAGGGFDAAAGASTCTIQVNVRSLAAGTYTNGAAAITAIGGMVNGVTDQALIVTQPTLTKTFGFPARNQGEANSIVFVLANAGAGNPAQGGIAFTETLPSNLVFTPASPTVTYGAGCSGTVAFSGSPLDTAAFTNVAMTAGTASCTITILDVVNKTGTSNNACGALPAAFTNAASNITGTVNVTNGVTPQCVTINPIPTLTKAFGAATVGIGQATTLVFTVNNSAADTVNRSGLAFTDTLPAGVSIANPPAPTTNGQCGTPAFTAADGAQPFTATAISVNAGQVCTITVAVRGTAAGAHVNGLAQLSAVAGLASLVTDQTLTVTQASLTKAFLPATIDAGGVSTLTFTLTNGAGNPAQSGIAFTDTLPAGVTVATIPNIASNCPSGPGAVTAGGATIAVAGASMNAAQATCTISVDVTSGLPGAYGNTDAGNITLAQRIGTTGVNATLVVQARPTLTKAFATAALGLGQATTLTFSVNNAAAGSVNRAALSFTDTLPAGLAIANPPVPATNGQCGAPAFTAVDGTQPFTAASIAVNAGQVCTITVTVTGTTLGAKTNGALQVTAISGMVNGVTDQTVTVVQPTLTKAFGTGAINDGATTTLVFTLANGAGNPAQGGIGFTDTLPAGLAINSPTPALAYSAGCSGPATGAYVAGTRVLTLSAVAMAGGTAACTVTVSGVTNATSQVNASCPSPGFTNGAAAIGLPVHVANGVSDQCLLVNRINPALTKAFSPATIDQGSTSTLTFTLANSGTNPAQSGINFTDTLPPGVLVATLANLTTNCPSGTAAIAALGGGGTITVTGATMSAGQASCTLAVDVTAAASGAYANTNAANIGATANVTTTGVNATLTVLPLPALAKAFNPASVGTGQNAVLTFTITNLAGAPGRTGLAFTDTLPAGVVIGTPAGVLNTCGGSPTITASPGAAVFSVGGTGVNTVAGPSSCTIAVNVTSPTAGTYVNGAPQVAVQGLLNAVTDQTLAVLARPTAAKAFGAAAIAAGGTTSLAITLSNPNAVPLSGVGFTDVFPVAPGAMTLANVTTSNTCGGTLADSGGGALNVGDAGIQLGGGTIPAGLACVVTVNVTAGAAGTYTNTLAAGAVASANAGSNTAPASANLLVTAAATIAKAFAPAGIAVDGTSTITFTLANANAIALTAAGFTDALAGMAIAANGVAGGTCARTGPINVTAGQVALAFTGLTIPAGGSCTVTVVVTSDIPGAHDNQSSGVSTAEAVTGPGSNIATLTVTAAAPAIAKAFSPAAIAADGTSTLTFTIANTNGVQLTSAGFTDNLVNMAIASAGAAGGTCTGAAGNTFTAGQASLTFSNLTIAANGSCTVTVVVTGDTPGAHDNTASGVASTQAPTGPASNTATLTVTAAAPTIAKAFAPATIAAGATSTVTVTLANTLGVPLTGGAFTDTLANMSISAAGAAAGTCAGASANSFSAGATALSFTGITVPANSSCTVTFVVASNIPGTHDNATSAFSSVEAPASAASNTAALTVTAVAPSIAKAFAPASIVADATSTITFTIANPLGVPLTSANFTDTLANMSVAAAGGAGGTCAGAAGNFLAAGQTGLALTGLTIPASGSCTVTVVVSSDLPGVHPNQASGVASTQAPLGAPSNSASLAVTAAPATIAKAFAPAGIPVNSTSTITFTLANANGIPLTGAGFTDTLAGMQVDANGAAGGTCAGAAGNVLAAGQTALAFTGLAIPANGSCTVTVVVLGNVIGTHPNQASGVASTEAGTGAASNVANLTVQPLPPTIAKQFSPASILSGGTTALVVTIGNPNPIAITVTSVTDNYPAGVTTAGTPAQSTTCTGGAVSSNANSVTLTGGTVPLNGSCTFQVNVTAPVQGLYANTIPVGALTTSGGFNTLAANATLTVDPVADLAVVKNAPATIGTGQLLAYTVSVINNGPDPASGATFADTVPAQVTGVGAVCGAATGGATCGTVNVAGNAVTSTITTLPAGASVTFTISGTASGLGATTNTATAAAPAGVFDPVAANNTSSATTTILAPDLTLVKNHAGNFTVGVNGAYSLTASNGTGTLSTTGVVTVVDTLPAGLTYVSGGGAGWSCSAAGQAVTCTTAGVIAAGASAPVLTITVAVSSTAVPSVLNVASVSGGGEPAAASGNNTASDNTIVVSTAVNAFAPDGVRTGMPGSAVFYPHIFNAGLAGSVAFSTTAVAIPAVPGWSQTIYRDTNCNGALDGAEGGAPLAGAVAVNPGDAVCIIVRDSIPGAAPYNAQNVIAVTATFNGTTPYTRTDTTTVGAAAGAGLTLAKTVRNVTQGGVAGATGTALPNDVLEYTITYTNSGSGPVSAIVVTDATPAFTLYLSAACGALPGNLTACSVTTQPAVNGTGSVVWTLAGSLLSSGSGSVSYQVRVSN